MTISVTSKHYWIDTISAFEVEAMRVVGEKPSTNQFPDNGRVYSAGFKYEPVHSFQALGTNIVNFFNWHRKSAENDLEKLKEYENKLFNLSNYHQDLCAKLEQHPDASVSTDIQTLLETVKKIDEKRIQEAESTFVFRVTLPLGCIAWLIGRVAPWMGTLGKSALLVAAVISLYNQIMHGRDTVWAKSQYEEIGKQAERILYKLSYYDANMKLQNKQIADHQCLSTNFSSTYKIELPSDDDLKNITYPEIPQEIPSSTHSGS